MPPKTVFSEVTAAATAAVSGKMLISSALTRAVVEHFVSPLLLEDNSDVIKKWRKLPLHRETQRGKLPFATSPVPVAPRRSHTGKQALMSPSLGGAKEVFFGRQARNAQRSVLLTAAETRQFKEDLERWFLALNERGAAQFGLSLE